MSKVLPVLLFYILLISNCTKTSQNSITQTSTLNALLTGYYDGNITCKELLKHGDFGIGTFNRLDGEMIILDKSVFQIKSDGQIKMPILEAKTPFATICTFNADTIFQINKKMDFKEVEAFLDETFKNQNTFYAIRIEGDYLNMKTRSVPAQEKPYRPLKEIAKYQPEFTFETIAGTLIGFRCPIFVKNINVPGYHFHFIDKAHSKGGHVLNFELQKAWCEVDLFYDLRLILPKDPDFQNMDLSKDLSVDRTQVEK